MKRITYSKYFLSGILVGLSVRCSITMPNSEVSRYMQGLNGFTLENPGSDAVTGDLYWAYNIGSEECKGVN